MRATTGAMPLFYRNPVPLGIERHGKLRYDRPASFAFARDSNALPVVLEEFAQVGRSYPIVFAPGPDPAPLALVGVRAEQNLFVDVDGRWVEGAYVPAYVRRYPFIFMTSPAEDRFILCVDEGSGLVHPGGAEPLYVSDRPAPVLDDALRLCAEYQRRYTAALSFARTLREAEVLIERAAQITLKSGASLNLTGFLVIDEAKLDAVPNRTFLDWRRHGWLSFIYLHLASLQSWATLIDRAAVTEPEPADTIRP